MGCNVGRASHGTHCIIEKLNKITGEKYKWDDWSLEEIKTLLDLYLIISKKEQHIFDLIYKYHGCDSWEDIFRDYDKGYLRDKAIGVEIAIKEIVERQNENSDESENEA
jgi:hypothetical protein